METKTVSLHLANELNEYQQVLKEDAIVTARRVGINLECYSANDQIMLQITQIYSSIQKRPIDRTNLILVLPVRDDALNRIAQDSVKLGVGWICLNRQMTFLDALRKQYTEVPIGFIGPDQTEVGRIQGRQFKALLPNGGKVLYVQGSADTSAARNRLAGMLEELAGTNVEIVDVLDGGWTTEIAQRGVGRWLRMLLPGGARVDLIGCQSDSMAVGARAALETVSEYFNRPELLSIPVTGCDGLADGGRKLVDEGKLAATIIVPVTGKIAVEVAVRALITGESPPRELLLHSVSYPEEDSFYFRRTQRVS